MSNRNLVYDVGMNNGDDTAHYLASGYRVVAIEADPLLVSNARQRFESAIAEGRLQILNVAVAETTGVCQFWVSEKNEWSSFDRRNATKFRKGCRPIDVQCVRFQDILLEHGVPHYLKIDIEGNDALCVDALDPSNLPEFVSLEVTSLLDFARLARLGYNAFKVIRQNDFSQVNFDDLTSVRTLLQLKFEGHPIVMRGLSLAGRTAMRIANTRQNRPRQRSSRPSTSHSSPGQFPFGSSGAFGDETDGVWQSLDEAAFNWLTFRRLGFYRFPGTLSHWFDLHATKMPAPPDGRLAQVRFGAILSPPALAAWENASPAG